MLFFLQMYREQAVEMGFDEFHMFMRCVQFEFATHKDDADQPPPLFMTALQEDDSNLDRYTPAKLFLAIQELDEKHVGMFSFRTKEGCLKVCVVLSWMTSGSALRCTS